MSISEAPCLTALAASKALVAAVCAPDGKPVTHASATSPDNSPLGIGNSDGEKQTAATFIAFASSQSLTMS